MKLVPDVWHDAWGRTGAAGAVERGVTAAEAMREGACRYGG